jgi:hypothetical protein
LPPRSSSSARSLPSRRSTGPRCCASVGSERG